MSDAAPADVWMCTTSPWLRAAWKIESICGSHSGSSGRPPSRKLVLSATTPASPAWASAAAVSSASCGRGETHSPQRIRSSAAAADRTSSLNENETSAWGTP